MSQAISTQHPAVVLRSRYQQLRALLAVAMIAVVGLTTAVVVLAIQNDDTLVRSSSQVSAPSASAIRSDGGPEESAVAATLEPRPAAAGTDESRIAAAVGSADVTPTGTSRPDESAVASAISGH